MAGPETVGGTDFIIIINIGKQFMNKTFANALVKDKGNMGIDTAVRDSLLTFYQRNMYIDSRPGNPMQAIMEDTEDQCLEKASHHGFDYLILTWEGNIIDIYRYHHACFKAVEDLDEKTNGEWLVSGHIMNQYENRAMFDDPQKDDWKNSFWLYPITAVVNIKKWEELGRPSWGNDDVNKDIIEVIASEECVHDNYTPLQLSAGAETVTTKVKKGWNIINASLTNGLPIHNVSNDIRATQTYLYPEVSIERYNSFWQALHLMPKLTDQYKRVLENLLHSKYPRRINDRTWQCFIKNTEDYQPRDVYSGSVDWTDVDTIILPSSGFKDFIVSMGKTALRKKVDVIHFDIIGQCVLIRKEVIERWDGTRSNFTEVLGSIAQRFKEQGKDCFHMNAMTELAEAYDTMLPHFHDEEDLRKCWLEFKTFNHSYIEADMLDDPFGVIKLVKGKNVYICLSDIAGWRNNIIGYGYQTLRKNIITCISKFKGRNITGYVDYKDPGTDLQLWQHFDIALEFLNKPLTR